MSCLTIDISDIKTKTPLNALSRISAYQQQEADPSLISQKLEKAAQHKQKLLELRRQQKAEFEQRKKEAHAALIQENINSPFKFKLRLLTKVEDNALEKHLEHQKQVIETRHS